MLEIIVGSVIVDLSALLSLLKVFLKSSKDQMRPNTIVKIKSKIQAFADQRHHQG